MPIYSYKCNRCGKVIDERRPVEQRDHKIIMHFKEVDGEFMECKGMVRRVYRAAHNAAIPGQHNRINRHWNESGRPIEREFADVMINHDE